MDSLAPPSTRVATPPGTSTAPTNGTPPSSPATPKTPPAVDRRSVSAPAVATPTTPQQPARLTEQLVGARRALVVLPSAEAVDQAGLVLAQQGAVRVHTPADLETLMETVHREDGQWVHTPGPLAQALQHGGTLVLHYDHAAACEAESLNSLFDTPPSFAGAPVHPDLRVVGLLREETLKKQTVAFASRFDRLVNGPELDPVTDRLSAVIQREPHQAVGTVIDLHQANHWREALLPHYGLDAQGAICEAPGRWAAAVAQGQAITLRNPPMQDPHFRDALRGLMDAHPQVSVHFVHGYSEAEDTAMRARVTFAPAAAAGAQAVNGRTFDILFATYAVRDGGFVRSPGLLEQGRHALHITGDLTPAQWNRLLHTDVPLTLSLAPHVRPPAGRDPAPRAAGEKVPAWKPEAPLPTGHALVVRSSDVEHTAQVLRASAPEAQVFHVTPGMQLNDLVMRLDRSAAGYSARPMELLQALEAGRPVVLRGLEYAPELRQQLDSLLHQTPPALFVNGALRTFSGPIVALVPARSAVTATQVQQHRAPDSGHLDTEIAALLAKRHPALPTDFAGAALQALTKARKAVAPAQPDAPGPPSTYAALERAADLFMQRRLATGQAASPSSIGRAVFDAVRSEFAHGDLADLQRLCGCTPPSLGAPGEAWDRRRDRCLELLQNERGVFLQGPPGTGKSHVVDSLVTGLKGRAFGPINAGATSTHATVVGEAAYVQGQTQFLAGPVAAWAADRGPGAKVLVVDEANLTPDHFWEFLRGAWEVPPHVLVDGRRVELTPGHKILFTGNDDSLPGRGLHPTLKEKLNTVYFPALPPPLVAARIATPLAERHAPSAALAARISALATETYVRLRHHDSMSIRSVQEMVLRGCMTAQQAGPQVSDAALHTAMLRAAAGNVPVVEAEALAHWSRLRSGGDAATPAPSQVQQVLAGTQSGAGLVMVPSAVALAEDIGHFLASRAFRQARGVNASGQRALLVEGPSGRGKDVSVRQALEAAQVPHQVVNAGLGFADLRKALEAAQKQGHVLVVSELNLLPSHVLEGELNDLLTGNAHPGFALIATTNPGSFSGRAELSSALRSRFVMRTLQPYTGPELRAILDAQGQGTPQQRQAIVDHHMALSASADPGKQPTPRDALRAAGLLASAPNAATAIASAYAIFDTLGVKPTHAETSEPATLPVTQQVARLVAPELTVDIRGGAPSSPWGAPVPQQTAALVGAQLPPALQVAQATIQATVQAAGWPWPSTPGPTQALQEAQVALQALARHAGGEAFGHALRSHVTQQLLGDIARQRTATPQALAGPMLALLALDPAARPQVEAWSRQKAAGPVQRAAVLALQLLPTAEAVLQAAPGSAAARQALARIDSGVASIAVVPPAATAKADAPPAATAKAGIGGPTARPARTFSPLRALSPARVNRLLPSTLRNPSKAAPRIPWGLPSLGKTTNSGLFDDGPSVSLPVRWEPVPGSPEKAYFPLQTYDTLSGKAFGNGRGAHAPVAGPLGARVGSMAIDLPRKAGAQAPGLYVPHGQAPTNVQWENAAGQTGSAVAKLDRQGRWGVRLPRGTEATLLRYDVHETTSAESLPAFKALGAKIDYSLWPQLQGQIEAVRGLDPEAAVPQLHMFFKRNILYSNAPDVKEHYRSYPGHGPDALLALRAGMCTEAATAFAAVVRDALQLPTRVVTGHTGKAGAPLGDGHAWTQVYLPSQGWTVFDPTGENADADTLARLYPDRAVEAAAPPTPPPEPEFKRAPMGRPRRVVTSPYDDPTGEIRAAVKQAIAPVLMDAAMDVQEAYTATPTGQLDVLRLARGDAKPFLAQGVGVQQRPRLLAIPSFKIAVGDSQQEVWAAAFALGAQVDVVKANGDVVRTKTLNEFIGCAEKNFPMRRRFSATHYVAEAYPQQGNIINELLGAGMLAAEGCSQRLARLPRLHAATARDTIEALSQRSDAELGDMQQLTVAGEFSADALEDLLKRTPKLGSLTLENSQDGTLYFIPHLPRLTQLTARSGSVWFAYLSSRCRLETTADALFTVHGEDTSTVLNWSPRVRFITEDNVMHHGSPDHQSARWSFPKGDAPPVGEY